MSDRTDGPVLVTGGTGTLGRLVVPRLQQAGRTVRVLSRGRRPAPSGGGSQVQYVRGDVGTGDGLDAALAGVEVVVHLAGGAKGDDELARQVVRAASRARIAHLVFVSVVGADRVPVESAVDRAIFGYYAAKRTAEEVIAGSDVPWTTVRATQFHEFVAQVGDQLARLPLVTSWSGVRFQPLDAAEVAGRVVKLSLGSPSGLVPDLGGPKVYDMATLLRDYLLARGRRRLIVPVRLPGRAARAVREGANLNRDRSVGRRTWEEFLAGVASVS